MEEQEGIREHFPEKRLLDPNDPLDLESLITILKKAPHHRTQSDNADLYQVVKNNKLFSSFFKEMPHQTCVHLLQSFGHMTYFKSQEVFQTGESAKHFFLLLKGSVSILAPIKKPSHLVSFNERKGSRRNTGMSNAGSVAAGPSIFSGGMRRAAVIELPAFDKGCFDFRNSRRDSFASDNDGDVSMLSEFPVKEEKVEKVDDLPMTAHQMQLMYPDHAVLNDLKEGDHFGEIALTHRTVRTATVVCKETCHFLVLNAVAYQKILKEYEGIQQREIVHFLQTISMIKDWKIARLTALTRHLVFETAKRNQLIYDFGANANQIYFIKQGEVEIISQTLVEPPKDEEFCRRQSLRRDSISLDKSKLLNMNPLWNSQQKQSKKQHIKIALLGPSQSFGEDEVIKGDPIRTTKALVTSQTLEYYVIDSAKLIENAIDPTGYLNELRNTSIRQEWRDKFQSEVSFQQTEAQNRRESFRGDMFNQLPAPLTKQGTLSTAKNGSTPLSKFAKVQHVLTARANFSRGHQHQDENAPLDDLKAATQREALPLEASPLKNIVRHARTTSLVKPVAPQVRPSGQSSPKSPKLLLARQQSSFGNIVTKSEDLKNEELNSPKPQNNKLWAFNVETHLAQFRNLFTPKVKKRYRGKFSSMPHSRNSSQPREEEVSPEVPISPLTIFECGRPITSPLVTLNSPATANISELMSVDTSSARKPNTAAISSKSSGLSPNTSSAKGFKSIVDLISMSSRTTSEKDSQIVKFGDSDLNFIRNNSNVDKLITEVTKKLEPEETKLRRIQGFDKMFDPLKSYQRTGKMTVLPQFFVKSSLTSNMSSLAVSPKANDISSKMISFTQKMEGLNGNINVTGMSPILISKLKKKELSIRDSIGDSSSKEKTIMLGFKGGKKTLRSPDSLGNKKGLLAIN